MLYFDTSFLVPLFKRETRSADVERFMDSVIDGVTTISHWTRVEFASLVAKEIRMGLLTPGQAEEVDAAFEAFSEKNCTVLDVARGDFELAKHHLSERRRGLRAGDALHLAIAANAGAEAVYSLDRTMIAAGVSLGLPVNVGFPAPT